MVRSSCCHIVDAFVPNSSDVVELDTEPRQKVSSMFLGMFDIIDFARFVARRIVFVGGFVSVCFVFGDEHGGAAARTAIIDAEPVLDALVVKNIALATSLSSRYDRVFGFEFFQANRATRAAVAAKANWCTAGVFACCSRSCSVVNQRVHY